MKNGLKLIICLATLLSVQCSVFANAIDKTISQSEINKAGISISIKEVGSGKVIYEQNSQKPTLPASTLKILTLAASVDTLGKDYKFSTKLYKNTNNELFLKLGADPFLTSSDLNRIFESAVKNKKILSPKFIYVDDYVFDSTEWGEGWQWDDDLNPLMPKFSSYNIDKNLLNITIAPTNINAPANIFTSKFYPITFMNLVTTGNENNISISRNNSISPDIITIEGTVKKQETEFIPINHHKRYFILRIEDAIRSAKMDFVAETVFKLAGGKYVNNTGSLANSQKMLNNYFDKLSLNYENIKIVDGSGVSKNNLMTTDFMTEFLSKQEVIDTLKPELPTSGEGTLKNRMLYFKDNLRAKTGTLSDVSAIAGYITSRTGRTYAFDIMINDPKSKSNDKKSLEEYVLRDIYTNY